MYLIGLAKTQEERQAVFRFRSGSLSEASGRHSHASGHRAEMVRDALDDRAHIFVAHDRSGQVVGASRTNFARDSFLGWPVDVLHVSMGNLQITSLSTRLNVERDHQGEALATRLAMAQYAFCLRERIGLDFVPSRPDWVPFFERLGYRIVGRELEYPAVGRIRLLVLLLNDMEHLKSVDSPLVDTLREFRAERERLTGSLEPCSLSA